MQETSTLTRLRKRVTAAGFTLHEFNATEWHNLYNPSPEKLVMGYGRLAICAPLQGLEDAEGIKDVAAMVTTATQTDEGLNALNMWMSGFEYAVKHRR